MRTAYPEGRSIAALARDHDVSRGAIRTAVADLLPEYTAAAPDAPAPELSVALDMPGKVADFLRAADLEPAERATLDQGVTVQRGQGYTLRVTAVPTIHCRLLDGSPGTSAVPRATPRSGSPGLQDHPVAGFWRIWVTPPKGAGIHGPHGRTAPALQGRGLIIAVCGWVGSGRGAVLALRPARFPDPPAAPAVRVSTQRALHVPWPVVSR
ncbi:hypothetical protein ACFYQA_05325 [Streptomyces sp. NPDC005774]|uniref:hypothetical protein n=1 Tax=Streptomyces sp. NPDC005774 TaxID=3364728 RepID=UPI003680A054